MYLVYHLAIAYSTNASRGLSPTAPRLYVSAPIGWGIKTRSSAENTIFIVYANCLQVTNDCSKQLCIGNRDIFFIGI